MRENKGNELRSFFLNNGLVAVGTEVVHRRFGVGYVDYIHNTHSQYPIKIHFPEFGCYVFFNFAGFSHHMELATNLTDWWGTKIEKSSIQHFVNSISKWELRFLRLAFHISEWSKDPSTKCGAVIADNDKRVISIGYNGFPRGVDDATDLENREKKYMKIIHAETNAILFANVDLTGCTIYTTFHPCARCTGLIIQSGIKEIFAPVPSKELYDRWKSDIETAQEMIKQAPGMSLKLVSNSLLK